VGLGVAEVGTMGRPAMRVVGYCVVCRRVKYVTVRVASLATGAPTGVCDECEKEGR
jgi:hypothetical protein